MDPRSWYGPLLCIDERKGRERERDGEDDGAGRDGERAVPVFSIVRYPPGIFIIRDIV